MGFPISRLKYSAQIYDNDFDYGYNYDSGSDKRENNKLKWFFWSQKTRFQKWLNALLYCVLFPNFVFLYIVDTFWTFSYHGIQWICNEHWICSKLRKANRVISVQPYSGTWKCDQSVQIKRTSRDDDDDNNDDAETGKSLCISNTTFVAVNKNTPKTVWHCSHQKIHNFILDAHVQNSFVYCETCIVDSMQNFLEFRISHNEWLVHVSAMFGQAKTRSYFFPLICLSESDNRLPATKDVCTCVNNIEHITINLTQILHLKNFFFPCTSKYVKTIFGACAASVVNICILIYYFILLGKLW